MSSSEVVLWKGKLPVSIPASINSAQDLMPYALQLSRRDKSQIEFAFVHGNYEMASSYIWAKSFSSLKLQLSKLGMNFIAEMLDRPDIDESSNIDQKLTDFEAIRLAEELGVISGTGSLRLRHSLEKLNHFGSLEGEESEDFQMSVDEAISVIRACIENVLGQEKIEAALDFQKFRNRLEDELVAEEDLDVNKVLTSPYFFQRASIRILLSLIKSTTSAQLENTLANANIIIPLLWKKLRKPEKWQIGRSYAEMFAEGRGKAASGLKRVLLKVKGFDYVPEDLRSTSYIKAAHAVLSAHEAMRNFYSEPAPMKLLYEMGSVIPIPAFPICMSAVLSVKLGNYYGISYDAQGYANSMMSSISQDRWIYFLNECLQSDERILYKLLQEGPLARWCELVIKYDLRGIADQELTDKDIKQLIIEASEKRTSRVSSIATKLINKLGYKSA